MPPYNQNNYGSGNPMMYQNPTSPNIDRGNFQNSSLNNYNTNYGAPPKPTHEVKQGLPGKVIMSPEEITVGDVPNDGSIGVFVMRDFSSIILKQWNNRGTIDTVVYIPLQVQNSNGGESGGKIDVDFSPIYERLDRIEKAVKKNGYKKPYKPNNQNGGNQ